MFGYGDDNMGQYGYLRVQDGTQLTVFGDKMTFPGELTVTTLNGINPSNISLNDHVHNYNDLLNIPETFNPSEHTHSFNDLINVPEIALENHTHNYFDLVNISETFKPSEHKHDSLYAPNIHKHYTFDNNITFNTIFDNSIKYWSKWIS